MTSLSVNIPKLKNLMQAMPEIAAAYLFGSAAEGGPVVNDLDLLVLTFPGVNQDQAYFDILGRLSQELCLPEERIDLIFFELDVVDPHVLHSAINNGIIIKNQNPELLSERIDQLSLFFLINESYIQRAKALLEEQLEEFCANRQRTSETLP
jgi:predicted nucleotidyltransferase